MSKTGQNIGSFLLGTSSAYMKARQQRQRQQQQQSQGSPNPGAAQQAMPKSQPATQTAPPAGQPNPGAVGQPASPGIPAGDNPQAVAQAIPTGPAPAQAPVQSALSQSAATAQPAVQTTASGADSLAAGSPLASGAPGSVAGAASTGAAPAAAAAPGAATAGGGAVSGALGAADAAGAAGAAGAGLGAADAAGAAGAAGAGVGAADAAGIGAGAAGAAGAGAAGAAGAGAAGAAGTAAGAVAGGAAVDAAAGAVAADVLPEVALLLAAERGGYVHPMAHHQHPVWPLLHHVAGVGQGIPVEHPKPAGTDTVNEQQQPQGEQPLAQGGLVQTHPPQPANFGGARPPPGTHVFANGGPVRGGAPNPVIHGKRQAMPVGPNSGIVPASTEGQAVTMAQGGPVPGYDDGGIAAGYQMMQPTSPGQTPMIGKAAGLAEGFTSGVATGHNLAEMWQQHQYRNALADQQQAQGQVVQQGLVAEGAQAPDQHMSLHDHVNHFFSELHDTFLGHDQDPEMAKAVAEHQARIAARTAAPQQGVPAPAAGGAAAAPIPAAAAPGAAAPVPAAGGAPGAASAAPAPQAAPNAGAARGAIPAPQSPGVQTVSQATTAARTSSSDPATAGAQSVASPVAVASAISSPETKTGTPETPPKGGANYSLGPQEISRLEAAKTKAAMAAARAGLDPTKVYAALSAQQNAAFQGQYLRNIGAANTALMNGDQQGMEDALRSASYYIPNGQSLNLRTATQDDVKRAQQLNPRAGAPFAVGDHIIQNPFYGMPGHSGEQQLVPITPLTLSNMAQAALHPENFATEMYGQYKVGVQAQTELEKAAAYQTGMVGRWMQGDAQMIRQQVAQAMFPANYAQTMSKAELERAQAAEWRFRASGQGGGTKITAANALAYSKQGQAEFDNQAQGQLRPAPTVVPDPGGLKNKDGTPVMVPNPHGGQPQRDPTTISPIYRGLTPAERQQGGAMAQQISAANIGDGMTPGTAAEIAARVQIASRTPNANHKGDDGKVYPNLVISHGEDGKAPHVSVWDGHRYMQAWTSPNILPEGPVPGAIDTSGGNAGGGAGEPPEMPIEEPPT